MAAMKNSGTVRAAALAGASVLALAAGCSSQQELSYTGFYGPEPDAAFEQEAEPTGAMVLASGDVEGLQLYYAFLVWLGNHEHGIFATVNDSPVAK